MNTLLIIVIYLFYSIHDGVGISCSMQLSGKFFSRNFADPLPLTLHRRSEYSLSTMVRICASLILFLTFSIWAGAASGPGEFMETFLPGWKKQWTERHFTSTRNRFQIIQEASNPVLRVDSWKSASGIWRSWEVQPVQNGIVSWRWKIKESLSRNLRETAKEGDDFAARVFVVFEPHFLRWKTRSVCYVWAGSEPKGTVFRSPYSDSVATIVLQSGNENAGQWVTEKRNFVDDYQNFFGRDPERISAIALMVDTDNTQSHARAWFDDLFVRVNDPELHEGDRNP